MSPKTLEALRGSIRKWRLIVIGEGVDRGAENCPLCALFDTEDADCIGCPVYEKTGEHGCGNTPYTKFADAEDTDYYIFTGGYLEPSFEHRVIGPRSQQVAIDEYNFLVSLLPEGAEP